MQRTMVVVVAAALALAGIGCGGSDEPTAAEFAKQANAVCAKAQQRLRDGAKREVEFIDVYIASQHAKADGIAAVTPPAALRSTYEQYRRALIARAQLMDKYAPAIKQGKKPPLTVKGVELSNREAELARALHLGKCIDEGQ